MRRSTRYVFGLVLLAGGCGDDLPTLILTGSSGAPGVATESSDGPNVTTTMNTTSTPPSTTTANPSTTTDPSSTTAETDTDDTLPEFMFDDSPPEDYTRVDRMGVPAVNAALLLSDAYNGASPSDDVKGSFIEDLRNGVVALHAAFDGDLKETAVLCDTDACMEQVTPLIVPDALRLDVTEYAGFPNGRIPGDPVMEMVLAVVLLDLDAKEQDFFTLVGMNPTSNDVPLSKLFPYFAEPHEAE